MSYLQKSGRLNARQEYYFFYSYYFQLRNKAVAYTSYFIKKLQFKVSWIFLDPALSLPELIYHLDVSLSNKLKVPATGLGNHLLS